jgi:hypothetical protein
MKTFALATLAAVAVALPSGNELRQSGSNVYNFEILTERSGTEVHFQSVFAAQNDLFLAFPSQSATCQNGADGNAPAVFQLNRDDGTLFLYSTNQPRQQVYVERAGDNQGSIGYLSTAESGPENAEYGGWKVDSGFLTYLDADLQACPNSIDGAWSVWLSGFENPGGNTGCLFFRSRAVESSDPRDCVYST